MLVGPSPRYIDDEEYVGGFTGEDIDGLLDSLDSNYLGWSSAMAPVIMGNADRPELGEELTNSFCRTDPEIARHFARVTFCPTTAPTCARVAVPTLILQCSRRRHRAAVGRALRHRQIAGSTLVDLDATGHCPNLSAPEETVAAIAGFLVVTAECRGRRRRPTGRRASQGAAAVPEDSADDLYEHAPCGYLSATPDGRSPGSTRPS